MPLIPLRSVPAADGLVCLDSKVRHAGAVLVPAGLVETLKPDAPRAIDGARANLEALVVELELVVDNRPSLGLISISKRLRASQVSDQTLSCIGIRMEQQKSTRKKRGSNIPMPERSTKIL